MIKIRDATVHDAESGCAVVRRSISELCGPDHHDDPDILERWLRNSTVDSFRHLLSQGSKSIMVATEGDVVLALGLVADDGTIHLNYVSPDARFRGVSRALLHALEARASERGNMSCKLLSTETARRFYLANGYK